MKYIVDRKKFADLLGKRPALVKAARLTENTCAKLIYEVSPYKRSDVYEYLPENLKTLKVTRAYIKSFRKEDEGRGLFKYDSIPLHIRKKLEPSERLAILNINKNLIKKFDSPTKEEWEFVISEGYQDVENVPADVWTQDLILKAFENIHYWRYTNELFSSLENIWSEDFVRKVVSKNPNLINLVPSKFITKEVLAIVLSANERIELKDIQIPADAWTQELADAAVKNYGGDITCIPQKFINDNNKKEAARQGFFNEVNDKSYPVLVAYVAHNWFNKQLLESVEDKEKLVIDVLMEAVSNNPNPVRALGNFIEEMEMNISEDLWIKILKILPEALNLIPKNNQTEAIINAFMDVSTPEIIDKCAEHIDLRKLKAKDMPLLINCKSRIIAGLMEKFMKCDCEDMKAPSDECIEIDVAPSEYMKIKRWFQEEV